MTQRRASAGKRAEAREAGKTPVAMKRCPLCDQSSDSWNYCPDDGVRLVPTDIPGSRVPTAGRTAILTILPREGGAVTRVLDANVTLIGAAPDNAIVLRDAEVRHRHAALRRFEGRFLLYEVEGQNAVFVNGRPIAADGHALSPGDTIALGDARLVFDLR